MRGAKFCVAILLILELFALGCGGGSGNSTRSQPVEVVFIGSSQTVDWQLPQSFPGKNYVKKGRLSDASADMLARFQTDVVGLKPRVVVIWAGENDIDRQLPLAQLQANIDAMRQQAATANIGVVFGTVPPKTGTDANQNPAIVEFNDWLRSYVASNKVQLADFYALLVDSAGMIKPEFANGTEHLTPAAYEVITPIAAAAIAAAMQ
ncbi:MAG TPA: GDSL-type esterase/lipase family protein [Clostridia bacterium]|nr:GDSL-type esterase/lipase family protein [Clostridia bacterium]